MIFTKASLYFWIIHKILCLLIPKNSILWKKKFEPLHSEWPKRSGAMRMRSMNRNKFFCRFLNFRKGYNTSPPDFHLKCKKGKNHFTLQYNIHILAQFFFPLLDYAVFLFDLLADLIDLLHQGFLNIHGKEYTSRQYPTSDNRQCIPTLRKLLPAFYSDIDIWVYSKLTNSTLSFPL